mgnify:CR=1 FL=1
MKVEVKHSKVKLVAQSHSLCHHSGIRRLASKLAVSLLVDSFTLFYKREYCYNYSCVMKT